MLTKAQSKQYPQHSSLERNPKLTALEKGLLRWTMAERGDKVLDACVGNGLMLEYLQRNMECEVCGFSDEMESVRASRSRLRNADIVYASREDIPWKNNTFESAYFNLTNAPLTETCLSEMLRVLKPGGQLLVGLRCMPGPLRRFSSLIRNGSDESDRSQARSYTLNLMKKLGFTQITWQSIDLMNGVAIAWKPMEPDA